MSLLWRNPHWLQSWNLSSHRSQPLYGFDRAELYQFHSLHNAKFTNKFKRLLVLSVSNRSMGFFFPIHLNFCVKLNHSHWVCGNEKDQVRKHLRIFYVHKSLGPWWLVVMPKKQLPHLSSLRARMTWGSVAGWSS